MLKGPLHGVPFSFKDMCALAGIFLYQLHLMRGEVNITGVDSSIGFTQWTNKPSETDAGVSRPCSVLVIALTVRFDQLVSLIRSQGGIIIAKTNVPQTMLAFECCNPLWGRTTNPWSDDHTWYTCHIFTTVLY
jgi:Asp-tRNA(Asn)/Glu-tRNA(Gln) amidotransferase A subunit family amidase